MEMRILNVTARRDAVDKLIWKAELRATDWGTSRLFLLASWSGDLVLYQQSIGKGGGMGPQVERVRLSARWSRSGDRNSVRTWATSPVNLLFETELPGDALERIEAFRGDNRLFARLEGTLFLITVRDEEYRSYVFEPELLTFGLSGTSGITLEDVARDLWQTMALWNTLADPQRILGVDFLTESFELSRERWDTEIRAVLRDENHIVPRAQSLPADVNGASVMGNSDEVLVSGPEFETANDNLASSLTDAKAALSERNYRECMELCSRVAQSIHGEMSAKKSTDYGSFHHEIKRHANALRTMYRPDDRVLEEFAPIIEHIARHVLTCTVSLYQVYQKMSQAD